ncbi:MAG: helix-turn-helix domain-containing protein [Candidatus Diapherotrites archaeon]
MSDPVISKFLETLGLTEYESKTLVTLFKFDEIEAPEISRRAQVPKTRIYDVLDRLVRRGLAIEIKGRPKRYRVIDRATAIDTLVERKKDDFKKIEDNAQTMKALIAGIGIIGDTQGEKIMKVKDSFDFERILSQEIANTKNSITGFAAISDDHQILKESIEKAKSKNIDLKFLNSVNKCPAQNCGKGKMDVKHFKHGINAFILDDKKVVMALSDFNKTAPEYHFVIWNDNKPMANALNHYFEKCWQQGKNL